MLQHVLRTTLETIINKHSLLLNPPVQVNLLPCDVQLVHQQHWETLVTSLIQCAKGSLQKVFTNLKTSCHLSWREPFRSLITVLLLKKIRTGFGMTGAFQTRAFSRMSCLFHRDNARLRSVLLTTAFGVKEFRHLTDLSPTCAIYDGVISQAKFHLLSSQTLTVTIFWMQLEVTIWGTEVKEVKKVTAVCGGAGGGTAFGFIIYYETKTL